MNNSKSDKPGPKDQYWTINIEIDYICTPQWVRRVQKRNFGSWILLS